MTGWGNAWDADNEGRSNDHPDFGEVERPRPQCHPAYNRTEPTSDGLDLR